MAANGIFAVAKGAYSDGVCDLMCPSTLDFSCAILRISLEFVLNTIVVLCVHYGSRLGGLGEFTYTQPIARTHAAQVVLAKDCEPAARRPSGGGCTVQTQSLTDTYGLMINNLL